MRAACALPTRDRAGKRSPQHPVAPESQESRDVQGARHGRWGELGCAQEGESPSSRSGFPWSHARSRRSWNLRLRADRVAARPSPRYVQPVCRVGTTPVTGLRDPEARAWEE
jgi:hypothetical protein